MALELGSLEMAVDALRRSIDAARLGLISDPAPWFDFGDARNLTSHTYDTEQAEAGYKTAQAFLPYAQEFLSRLKEKND